MTEPAETWTSIFDSRESLERAIETSRDPAGARFRDDQICNLKAVLTHPEFDAWSPARRRAYYSSFFNAARGPDVVTVAGAIMIVAGIFAALISQAMSTTVTSTIPSSFTGYDYIPASTSTTFNIGLLQNQLMVFQAGLALAIGGIVLVAASLVRAELRKLGHNGRRER